MANVAFVVSGDIRTATGGYTYDRRVMALLPAFGVNVRHVALPDSFPNPSDADLAETAKALAACPTDAALLIDGLVYGALPRTLIDGLNRRIIALVHHPLFLETDLPHARKVELRDSESAALAAAEHIVVVSRTTRRLLVEQLGVDPEKITIAEPGTDPANRATGTGTPLQILSVGAIMPRKAYDTLVEAVARLSDIDCRLTIAGATDRYPETVAALRDAIARLGLHDRVTLAGKVVPATLERLYESADLYVSASLFEGYGMAIAEAMARGLPIVTATGGAAAETAGRLTALRVDTGNVEQLAATLRKALTDKRLRDQLADASWEAGRALPTWHETSRRIAAVLLGLDA